MTPVLRRLATAGSSNRGIFPSTRPARRLAGGGAVGASAGLVPRRGRFRRGEADVQEVDEAPLRDRGARFRSRYRITRNPSNRPGSAHRAIVFFRPVVGGKPAGSGVGAGPRARIPACHSFEET
ncbi:MAG: hypothetical protein CMJ52_10190 [Planctomycetaceae bacterium]|nr:hypothetical protein [Planctomycetaceae bacterium]